MFVRIRFGDQVVLFRRQGLSRPTTAVSVGSIRVSGSALPLGLRIHGSIVSVKKICNEYSA